MYDTCLVGHEQEALSCVRGWLEVLKASHGRSTRMDGAFSLYRSATAD